MVFDTNFHSQLLSDRHQLLGLIDAIDGKNKRKVEDAAAELRRTRKGRGRPRKPRPISQEDQARRLQYQAELDVVYAALEPEALATPQGLGDRLKILVAKKIGYRQPGQVRAYRRYRDRKIEHLLDRLPKEKRLPPTKRVSVPWKEETVRSYLLVLRERYRLNVKKLESFPRDTPEYRRQMDEAKARLTVVERFLWSDHLRARELFLRRSRIIGAVGEVPTAANSVDDFRDYWILAVAELVADLGCRYGPAPEGTDETNADESEPEGQGGIATGELEESAA